MGAVLSRHPPHRPCYYCSFRRGNKYLQLKIMQPLPSGHGCLPGSRRMRPWDRGDAASERAKYVDIGTKGAASAAPCPSGSGLRSPGVPAFYPRGLLGRQGRARPGQATPGGARAPRAFPPSCPAERPDARPHQGRLDRPRNWFAGISRRGPAAPPPSPH